MILYYIHSDNFSSNGVNTSLAVMQIKYSISKVRSTDEPVKTKQDKYRTSYTAVYTAYKIRRHKYSVLLNNIDIVPTFFGHPNFFFFFLLLGSFSLCYIHLSVRLGFLISLHIAYREIFSIEKNYFPQVNSEVRVSWYIRQA